MNFQKSGRGTFLLSSHVFHNPKTCGNIPAHYVTSGDIMVLGFTRQSLQHSRLLFHKTTIKEDLTSG